MKLQKSRFGIAAVLGMACSLVGSAQAITIDWGEIAETQETPTETYTVTTTGFGTIDIEVTPDDGAAALNDNAAPASTVGLWGTITAIDGGRIAHQNASSNGSTGTRTFTINLDYTNFTGTASDLYFGYRAVNLRDGSTGNGARLDFSAPVTLTESVNGVTTIAPQGAGSRVTSDGGPGTTNAGVFVVQATSLPATITVRSGRGENFSAFYGVVVPEPSTGVLALLGATGLLFRRKRS